MQCNSVHTSARNYDLSQRGFAAAALRAVMMTQDD